MARQAEGGGSYLTVIRALHRMLWDEYAGGGWLPSGRELARTLRVSHATCCKALQRMVREGFIRNYPQRGHYAVPEYLCCRKIGLIFNEGEESPFLREPPAAPTAAALISEYGFDVQIIQHARPELLHENAVVHGVDGLLWFWPTRRMLPLLGAIYAEGETPLVTIHPDSAELTEDDLAAGCHVRRDGAALALSQLQQIAARGHQYILYAGNPDSARGRLFARAGLRLRPDCCVADTLLAGGTIGEILAAQPVDAIVSEGGGLHVHSLLAGLAQLPERGRPEVFVVPFAQLPAICGRFPHVKVTPLAQAEGENPGRAGARLLMEHILHRRPLRNLTVAPAGGA